MIAEEANNIQYLRHFRLCTVKRFVYGAIVTENISVIVRLVCDMVKHSTSPESECCVFTISHTKRTITITYINEICKQWECICACIRI